MTYGNFHSITSSGKEKSELAISAVAVKSSVEPRDTSKNDSS